MENIIKINETTLAVIQEAPRQEYTKKDIASKADDYRKAIANLKLEAEYWFNLEDKANEFELADEE